MTTTGGIAADQLKKSIERVEFLEDEKSGIGRNITEVYAEAKALGFDPKVMRKIVRLRKMADSERQEEEYLTDFYEKALGEKDENK